MPSEYKIGDLSIQPEGPPKYSSYFIQILNDVLVGFLKNMLFPKILDIPPHPPECSKRADKKGKFYT